MKIWAYWQGLDQRYRVLIKAVASLILNLLFAFYNGILGALSSSLIFVVSAVYYLLLCLMRFFAVVMGRKGHREQLAATMIGILLMILGILFPVMVLLTMKYKTAAFYSTIPMITIATFTFTKITTASITAVKYRSGKAVLIKAVNAIRYCEVAVSLLTMQQSMLVSFGEANDPSAVILNACTGAGVCIFIFILGIFTLKNGRKKQKHGKI